MEHFEIELSDEVAALINSTDHSWIDISWYPAAAWDAAELAIPAMNKQPDKLTADDLMASARLFNSLGRLLQRKSGNHRGFISMEKREERSAKARKAHETRRSRLAAAVAAPAPTEEESATRAEARAERARRIDKIAKLFQEVVEAEKPKLPDNVVRLVPRQRFDAPASLEEG